MPVPLIVITVIAAVLLFMMIGLWIERRFGAISFHRRLSDRVQLWALRVAGIWVITWLLLPIVALGQPAPKLEDTNAQQILLSNQRIGTIESRIAAVESLRLDARLSLLEDTRDEVRTMRQWMLGIIGGVVVIVITQILAVLGRPRERSAGQ